MKSRQAGTWKLSFLLNWSNSEHDHDGDRVGKVGSTGVVYVTYIITLPYHLHHFALVTKPSQWLVKVSLLIKHKLIISCFHTNERTRNRASA
jgi:hypothetical protein